MMQISLAAARVNAGFNQGKAAIMLGITPKTLRGYEKGKVVIPSDTLRVALNYIIFRPMQLDSVSLLTESMTKKF